MIVVEQKRTVAQKIPKQARAMRMILVILIFSSGTVFSKYYEKRRFDRSVYDGLESITTDERSFKKQRIFTDYETHFRAYNGKYENDCYLEKLNDDTAATGLPGHQLHQEEEASKVLYASTGALTKLEAWRIAGGRIVDFCQGRNIILLQNTVPIPEQTADPFFNIIPRDENDIVSRRVADVVLTPLISRAKRQIALEERQRLNENAKQTRVRRQAQQPRGRFRGQTQSQYLTVGSDDQKEGKAEAEATQQSSRAVVSGSRGMGQAQSMSMGSTGCEDCPKYPIEGAPERYLQLPASTGIGTNYPGTTSRTGGGNLPGSMIPYRSTMLEGRVVPAEVEPNSRTFLGILPGTSVGGTNGFPGVIPPNGQARGNLVYPGAIIPGTATGVTYPGPASPGSRITDGGNVYPGTVAPSGGVVPGSATIGGGETYPGGIMPGSTATRGGGAYPGSVSGTTTGGGVAYPGNVPGGVPYPANVPGTTTGSGAVYPGSITGTTTGGGAVYPANIPGTTTRGGAAYPGNVPGTTTGGGAIYPGSVPGTSAGGSAVYPGSVPGTTTRGGAAYPGNVPGTTTGGGAIYPGSVPGTSTAGGGVYPGSVPGTTTGGGAIYPGSVPGTTTGGGAVYPGNVPSTTTGGGVAYPGNVPGGSVPYPASVSGGGVPYPGSVPGTATGNGVVYPSSVPGGTTGGGVPYPSNMAGATAGGRVIYPGSVPGTATGGGVTYLDNVPGTPRGGGVIYPGSLPAGTMYIDGANYPRTAPGGSGVYPSNVPSTPTIGGVIYPGNIVPDSRTGTIYPEGAKPTSDGSYLSNIKKGETVPGQLITESKALADSKIYPTGQVSSPTGNRVMYPGMTIPGSLPGGIPSGTTTTGGEGGINYPSGVSPPAGQMRENVYYPGSIVPGSETGGRIMPGIPGIMPTGTGTYPESVVPGTAGHFVTGDQRSYPGGIAGTDGTGLYPQGTLSGTNVPNYGHNAIGTGSSSGANTMASYPDGTQGKAGQIGTGQSGISYPNGVMQYPGANMIQQPGAEKYPSSAAVVPPDYLPQQVQYPPGTVTWHDGQHQAIPDMTGGRASDGINRQGVGQYPSPGQIVGQQYPGLQHPTGTGSTTGTTGVSQYYQQASVPTREDDNSDSQASSSVKQIDSGTQASASAQGRYGEGTSQSQVTGTYSGSGSFSAQAGSSDVNKSVQTEITGNKDGATSNSQGTGGYGKSQAQVQLDSESGGTSTGAQSSGWNHGTNSQVQASSRGGMADAQANGEGSTSSQAQIGFQPYLKTDEKIERHSRPFQGGGTASAQSGTHRGQSQSQLEGSFQYGITYTGAAQAGSGSGAAASRKPFNFSHTDTELFKPFKPYNTQVAKNNKSEVANTSSDIDYEYNQEKRQQGLQTSSSSRKTVVTNATVENSQDRPNSKHNHSVEKSVHDTADNYDEEYYDEDYDNAQTQTAMSSKLSKAPFPEPNNSDHQSQTIHFTTGNQYDVRVNQDSNTAQDSDMFQPGQSLSGYTIPPGFRGRVTSVAGDETIAHGDGTSQSQTVSLTPVEPSITRENKSPLSETRSLKTTHERLIENHVLSKEKLHRTNSPKTRNQQNSMEYSKPITNMQIKPSYYTVTNSFAGKMDGSRNPRRKYEHRYYTKSSTCGYFTFSCNVVYGSNGRTKICKPKLPTHPDGTPMKC
ncbi:uncharacterized protein LOC143378886 isoform X3 [Andrena cerasifolii]|uniref:uncharacterized protein LOC143378886 isoform X3 n=1 Tax=Andrena cerasifolii TaxID=2819439 RepID=UPI0040375EFE